MRNNVLFIFFLIAFSLIFNGNLWADEEVILIGPKDQKYVLRFNGALGASWEEVKEIPKVTRQKFFKKPGEFVGGAGVAEVSENSVMVKEKGAKKFEPLKHDLLPNQTYTNAHIDKTDMILELSDGSIIVDGNLYPNKTFPDGIKQIVVEQNGDGFIYADKKGNLKTLTIHPRTKEIKVQLISTAKDTPHVKEIIPVNNRFLLVGNDNSLFYVGNNGEDIPLKLPEGFKLGKNSQVYSSRNPNKNIQNYLEGKGPLDFSKKDNLPPLAEKKPILKSAEEKSTKTKTKAEPPKESPLKKDFFLDPEKPEEFFKNMEKLEAEMNNKVIDQEGLNKALVQSWRDINLAAGKSHRTVLVAGPTGAGKSFSAETLGNLLFGNADRVLEINLSKYKTAAEIWSLFGAAKGYKSSDETSGTIPDFLMGRGKGANIIIANEVDKTVPEVIDAFMELLDKGRETTQNDETYELGKSIVILTTNKGANDIYPRGQKPLTRVERKKRSEMFTDKEVKELFLKVPDDNLSDHSKKLAPEIMARINTAVAALPPSYEGAIQIVTNELEASVAKLSKFHGITIEINGEVAKHLVDSGYIPEDGIRHVKDMVSSLTSSAIAEGMEKLGVKKGSTLNISLVPPEKAGDAPRFAFKNTSAPEKIVYLDAQKSIGSLDNPLTDPEFRQKLTTIQDRLGGHVMGQDDAVAIAAKSVRTKAINAKMPQPGVMLLLGPSGTGKTELATAIAKEHYGSEEKMITFNMGEIIKHGSLGNIFGSDKGYKGSDTISEFEKFLKKNRDTGGVILFDEIGNAGGGDPEEKAKILKYFYNMLDKGVWKSPTGESAPYNLSKFQFVFTSNEGQEFFENLPNDDLRLAVWNDVKDSNKMHTMLRDSHGWPEALLNRLKGNITMFKPLLKKERENIAEKFMDTVTKNLKLQHDIKAIEVSPKFYQTFSESLFSHSKGARGMKDTMEGSITDLIGDAILENYGDLPNATFSVSLTDNQEGKFKYVGKKSPERQVIAEVTVKVPGEPDKKYSKNITSEASPKTLASNSEIRKTAYHEAGHAVTSPQKVAHINIRGQGNRMGYVRYEPGSDSLTREAIVEKIASTLAGGEAEQLMTFGASSGWENDIKYARQLAIDAVTKYGLADKSLSFPIDSEGNIIVESPKVQTEIQALLDEGQKLARKTLTEKWPTLRMVTSQLLKNGEMSGKEFDEVVDRGSKITTKAKRGSKITTKVKEAKAHHLKPPLACEQGYKDL